MTPMPNGWERWALNCGSALKSSVGYERVDDWDLSITAFAWGVSIGTDDPGGAAGSLESDADFRSIHEILRRARVQHLHLKSGAKEVMTEEQEDAAIEPPCST